MRWREIIIGALVTLFVTALGGIIVYYATKEPQIPKRENLVYTIEDPTTFESPASSFCLQNIRLANVGDLSAEQITLGIMVRGPAKISDKHVSMSTGSAGTFSILKDDDRNLVITVPVMTPGEVITISLMLDGKDTPNIKVDAKSKSTIAKAGALIREPESKDKKGTSRILEVLLPLIAIMQIPIVLLLSTRFRRYLLRPLRRIIPSPQSVNNTAFLYIHRGLADEAKELIEGEIKNRGADSHLLGNHALCCAIEGHFESASKRIEAADFYATQKHERAVVLFNRSLIAYLKGDEDIATQHIKDALTLSPDEIPRYCQFSTVVSELKEKYHSLREICNRQGKKTQH